MLQNCLFNLIEFVLLRYPRTMKNTMRRKDARKEKRAQKRANIKQRKEEKKEQKREELKQLKALKRKEIEEKIEKLKEITGNDSLTSEQNCRIYIKLSNNSLSNVVFVLIAGNNDMCFDTVDFDTDFDPNEHDRKMEELFNKEYYDGAEDNVKPEFPDIDEELDIENTWDDYDPNANEIDMEDSHEGPHCEDPNFNVRTVYICI